MRDIAHSLTGGRSTNRESESVRLPSDISTHRLATYCLRLNYLLSISIFEIGRESPPSPCWEVAAAETAAGWHIKARYYIGTYSRADHDRSLATVADNIDKRISRESLLIVTG